MGIITVTSPQIDFQKVPSLKHQSSSTSTTEILNTAFYDESTDSEGDFDVSDEPEKIVEKPKEKEDDIFYLNIFAVILLTSIAQFSGLSDLFHYAIYLLTKYILSC
ncbi:unnamed protein product [Caenorhabditis angaria]|uniref:Uncharacterized protein n=1 Tax=Caenorhabditis angaria TaxID=860376 RepID=A0A9P1IFY8_9PELO|nr:unnamed protein product [Caenorhabditis angaria]